MQHRRKGRRFGRVSSQRKALYKTLIGSLILHEKITTTEAKAKEVKMLIDRYVTIAKRSKDEVKKLATVRLLASRLPKEAVKKIVGDDFMKRVESRNSGYTRVIKIGARRSDSARMAVIEFV